MEPAALAAGAEDTARRLLAEAASRAERQVATVRVTLGCLMFLFVGAVWLVAPIADRGLVAQLVAATVTAILVTLVGMAALAALTRERPTGRIAFLSSTADVLIVLANIGHTIVAGHAPGAFFSIFPAVWLIPVTMAAAALRYSPGLQIYVSGLFVAGLIILAMVGGFVSIETRQAMLPDYAFGFGMPSNVVRIIMIASAAFVLVMVARRGRRLLEQAVHETISRLSLTRFVPRELAPLLARPGMADLSAGRRQTVAIVFVDMRGSTARAEHTDPERFAVFMSSFRRRVMSAARAHGGMVDKFIGDGALIVFGVPDPAPDDAARAFACADMLVKLIARWNDKHDVQPPVAVGIGVQVGEVFCGVVGDPERLEFTVLGDPVNVAARLEKATKEHDTQILATAEAVAAAGVDWREVAVEHLPGRTEPVRLMAPRLGGSD